VGQKRLRTTGLKKCEKIMRTYRLIC